MQPSVPTPLCPPAPPGNSAGEPPDKFRQFPSLNGWRAVAILLVLANHARIINGCPAEIGRLSAKVFGSVLGVRCFFTVSGLLITWLMLKEESEGGNLSLKRFYARRAARILPVYLACLLVLAILHWTAFYPQPLHIWLQLLTFTRNFHQSAQPEFLPSAHLWSLSVEEQFYLLWPIAFLLLCRRPRLRLALLGLVFFIAAGWNTVTLLGAFNRHLYFLFQDHSTFVQMDCVTLGCVAAILLKFRPEEVQRFFQKNSLGIFCASSALIVIPEIVGTATTLQAVAFACLMLQSALFPHFPPFKILNHPWLVKVGILSYSMYIWQQLVFCFWPAPTLWFLAFPATLLVAWLSYSLVEKPFFPLRQRLRTRQE